MTSDGDCSIALDIYLRTVSGRSLAEALAAGHRFGDDVAEYAPVGEARESVLEHLREAGRVEADGFVVRVHGTKRRLEHVFACRLTALAESARARNTDTDPGIREATPAEFVAGLREAVNRYLGAPEQPLRPTARAIDDRWTPTPSIHVRFDTAPCLGELVRWVEAIEPADRWPIRGERPDIVCQIVGHDWDILLFISPFGVLGCDRCGAQQSNFPESAAQELLE